MPAKYAYTTIPIPDKIPANIFSLFLHPVSIVL
jgi:hypothetical protein